MKEIIIFYFSITSVVQIFLALSTYMISVTLGYPLVAKPLIQENTKLMLKLEHVLYCWWLKGTGMLVGLKGNKMSVESSPTPRHDPDERVSL